MDTLEKCQHCKHIKAGGVCYVKAVLLLIRLLTNSNITANLNLLSGPLNGQFNQFTRISRPTHTMQKL